MEDNRQKRRWTEFMTINHQPHFAQKSQEFMQRLRKNNKKEMFKKRRTLASSDIETLGLTKATEFEKVSQTDIPRKMWKQFHKLLFVESLTDETIPAVFKRLKNISYFLEQFDEQEDELFMVDGKHMFKNYSNSLQKILSLMTPTRQELNLFELVICKLFLLNI
jgi:hypothetical protein